MTKQTKWYKVKVGKKNEVVQHTYQNSSQSRRRRMGSNEGKVVCLTSVSGFSASWLLKLLLLRGYTVKGAVSDPNDSSNVDHLLKLDGAKERLHLFKADLLEEGSFDHAIEGCEGVFHTASPSFNDVKDKQIELLDSVVKGNLNVLKSCAKSSSVKRVILTSSIAAVLYNGRPRTPEVVVDETWFSDPNFLRKNEMWYLLAKTLAEEAAWKFAKENNIEMVALNPGMAIGPLLQPSDSTSFAPLVKLLNGAQTFPNSIMGWIHVKDVANAHIQAFEIPSANGRYCLIEKITHYSEAVKILHELYPTVQLPEKCENDKPFMPKYQVSKEKAKTLGIEFISFEASLRETVESLKENKLVNF